MQHVRKPAVIMLCLLLLTACWDRKEISDVNFIMGMGIDLIEDDTYRVTFQWAYPPQFSTEGAASSQEENTVFSIEADTIPLAMAKLTEISPRVPIFSHMELIALGEELLSKNAEDVINVIDREFEIRRTVNLVMVKGTAESMLRAETPFEKVEATGIKEIIQLSNRSSTFEKVNLNVFFNHETDPHSLSYIPIAELVSDTALHTTDSSESSWIKVERIAFLENYRLKRELSAREARAWLFVRGEVRDGTITQINTGNGKLVGRSIAQSTSKKLDKQKDQPSLTISVEEKVSIIDKPLAMSIVKMEEVLANSVKEQIEETIAKMQEENLDIFFIRSFIRHKDRKLWSEIKDEWEEVYPRLDFKVQVNIDIQHENALRNQIPE
ncbi:Ger(x)C family spore germination protein [Sediminibacillus sp. JSM 1682029]|uniref:Ger(x)C family spore germination protein n=1 Tax=Sediminibacillus sp. JSM 1682029 TaxID=3229857 RepID=UPI0035253191